MQPQSRELVEGDLVGWRHIERGAGHFVLRYFDGTITRIVEGWAVVRLTSGRTTVIPRTRLSRSTDLLDAFDWVPNGGMATQPWRWSHGVTVLWGAQ